jgi:flavodoxin
MISKPLSILLLSVLTAGLTQQANSADSAVVYFSVFENSANTDAVSGASRVSGQNIGNTAYIARQISEKTNSDLISLKTRTPYPAAFNIIVDVNHKEQQENADRPLSQIPDLSAYKRIFIGYPIWSMQLPRTVHTFLKQTDIKDKEIYLFCTHDGYGAGSTFASAASLLSANRVDTNGLAVDQHQISQSRQQVDNWLKNKTFAIPLKGEVQVAGQSFSFDFLDTPEARDFIKQLPVTLTLHEYGGREFYGSSAAPITVKSKGQYTFEDGTITYCPTNDTVAIFYSQSDRPTLSMAVYPIGRIKNGLDRFPKLPSSGKFTFQVKQ